MADLGQVERLAEEAHVGRAILDQQDLYRA
jgi:hypothetical protein